MPLPIAGNPDPKNSTESESKLIKYLNGVKILVYRIKTELDLNRSISLYPK